MRHRAGGRKRWAVDGRAGAVLLALAGLAGLAALMPATALAASAGLKPSEAPLVAVGQHYFGNTGHAGNAGDGAAVDLWLLPALLTGDAITVAWHSGSDPYLCLAQNVDDYNWAEEQNWCNASEEYSVAGNGSARTVIDVKSTTSAAYLEFWRNECGSCSNPYDFTIESIQHAIGVGLTPVTEIAPTSVLTGSANLSNGSPVPDGMAFTLSASWVTPVNKASHSRSYTVTSGGGAMAFPLNLPSSAEGKQVSLTITRPADPQYLAASSPAIEATVAKLAPPPRKHHRRHRHCSHGFKKRRVRGKVRCERVRRHHRHRQHRRRRYAATFATPSRFIVGKCKATDSLSIYPRWHGHFGFQALSGRPVESVRPGEVVKFVSHVAGGNVASFSLEADTEAPTFHFPKAMTILERGSHPAWSRAGGNPHWVLKDLCHWKVKKTISFLVAIDKKVQLGKRLCMPFAVWGRTGSNVEPYEPPVQRECLSVK
jgi:hypothetical protein